MAPAQSMLFAFSQSLQGISVFFLCLLLVTPVRAQNRSQEVQILIDFMQMTVGGGGVGMTTIDVNVNGYYNTWNSSDETPCSWVGVTCTPNSTVEELDLSGWKLPILRSVSPLSQLPDFRRLDLSFNSIVYSGIPDDIGNLTMLDRLDLSSSSISGPIPSSISKCRSLRYMNLGQNMLDGEIPSLLGLVNLQLLLLADNQLTGSLPKDLGQMTSLVGIYVSNNMLSGPIPSLSNLTSLSDLHLEINNFTNFEDSLSLAAKSLIFLSVSGNALSGLIPRGIVNLQNLESLDLSRNQLSGRIPYGFSKLWNESLLFLDFSQNQLTGEIPSDLLLGGKARGLSINLSRNFLNGSVLVNNNNFQLNCTVDLSHNQLNGSIASMIYNTEDAGIDSLFLNNNLFSEDIVDVFLLPLPLGYQVSTYELRLANNLLTGDLSRMVDQWSKEIFFFDVLDMRNNNLRMSVTDAIPDPLGATLRSISSGFFYIPDGLQLWIGGNNFSGTSLPTTYINDTDGRIRMLDLSNTHLTGDISGEIFNGTWFPGLQFLNLSNNDISGPVPGNVLLLPNLTVFDVSNNNLSGALPVIPLNSPFYDARIFAGNDALCGDPLPPCVAPPVTQYKSTGVQWWMLLIIVGGSVTLIVGSCLAAIWRWRVYQKLHEQDADLIRTLMERESATLMSLREIKKATDNFNEAEQIGEGGFGTVYRGKLSNGTAVAIKKSKREGSEKEKQQFLNEVRILSQVNHRNLVKLLGCCLENKVAVLVFEFISNGTLQEHLQGKCGEAPLRWKERLKIAVQTADALNYLHSAGTFPIFHRDVKSANILLDEDLDAKVADFGISRLAPRRATHVSTVAIQGTIGYIDPDYYTSLQLTDRSDVYSFGVVLLELMSGKPVIDVLRGGDNISLVYFAVPYIARGDLGGFIDPALEETFSDSAGEERESILNVARLALQCLDMRSKARPSMNEVLNELQSLWLQLCGISKQLEPVNEDDNEDPLLSESPWRNSSSTFIPSEASNGQMSVFFSVEGNFLSIIVIFSSSNFLCPSYGITLPPVSSDSKMGYVLQNLCIDRMSAARNREDFLVRFRSTPCADCQAFVQENPNCEGLLCVPSLFLADRGRSR